MVWKRLSLRDRVAALLVVLGLLAVTTGGVGFWYTHRMEILFTQVTEQDMAALQAVENLLRALVKQKGFVSYYFMDSNPAWLDQLHEHRREFRGHLESAERLLRTELDRRALAEIRSRYERYVQTKDRVIDSYRGGAREQGLRLHPEVRELFFQILDLCENYQKETVARVEAARDESRVGATRIRVLAGVGILAAVSLTGLFAFILFLQILGPIRRLASEDDGPGGAGDSGDEVKALRRRMHGLKEDAALVHSELEKSRVRLLQTEKMATVGKLAAGVAHSLRNPMTSIKMRLFSLERNLQMSRAQKEDLEVVTEEIRHMDNIVQNFLLYSRPAKLKTQRISPSEIVDATLGLLKHRLRSYGIDLELVRDAPLPEILADPDQLKEVFINLLVNAMEAMAGSGRITIEEKMDVQEPLGPVAVIRIRDSGPGIPEEIQQKVFEPFFSTKEEGTGLGLSIAVRIVSRHRGFLHVRSVEGQGTEFTITLSCREDPSWDPS